MKVTKDLVKTITKGIQEKKGGNIVVADLSKIDGTICHYFVICQGNSPQQVEAISDSISETVRLEVGEKPIHIEGLGNAQWVAMDYSDVLVHIFLPETREFYDLEHLWEDAKLTYIPNLD
jgi:ribosome-associated protein